MEIISVFGGDNNVGTSIAAQTIAEVLASGGENILFIDASDSLFDGYTGKTFDCYGIDQIGETVNPLQAVTRLNSYDAILGIRGLKRRDYPDDFFNEIFRYADGYSRVIIDAGSDPRGKLNILALKTAEKRIFIVRQNPKCIDKFKLAAENILIPEGVYQQKDIVIINAVRKSRLLFSEAQVGASLLRNTYKLPYVQKGIKCEYVRQGLGSISKKYRKAILDIINKEL